jgi:hypothetical protein
VNEIEIPPWDGKRRSTPGPVESRHTGDRVSYVFELDELLDYLGIETGAGDEVLAHVNGPDALADAGTLVITVEGQ